MSPRANGYASPESGPWPEAAQARPAFGGPETASAGKCPRPARADTTFTAVIQSCVNRGTVGYAHVGYNVGGIAGRQNGYLASCDNWGAVQAKKSCAGGITGRMDLGTVSQCGGWGDVKSESGDYVGGVAGLSLSSIRESWAKCALSGGKYVGGIAGSSSRVTDCLSLVEITEATQLSGAIAGEITGDYQGNRFVSEKLAGVDRVSLSGKAEAISYDQLTALDAAPENFRQLTLRFAADGKTLKEQSFHYGASLPESAYPAAPEKDGCYVRWDRESLNDLHFDTTVTAVYEPYVTTLSSDPQDAHPALLVEGKFRLGDRMEAQRSTSPVPGSWEALLRASLAFWPNGAPPPSPAPAALWRPGP